MTTDLSVYLFACSKPGVPDVFSSNYIYIYIYIEHRTFFVHEVVRMYVIHVLGVRCPLSAIMYMVHAWSTNHALDETTEETKLIETKLIYLPMVL